MQEAGLSGNAWTLSKFHILDPEKAKKGLTKRCRSYSRALKGFRTFDLSGTINLFLFVLSFTSVVRLKNDVRVRASDLIICFVIYERVSV